MKLLVAAEELCLLHMSSFLYYFLFSCIYFCIVSACSRIYPVFLGENGPFFACFVLFFFRTYIHQAALPILLGIKAYIIEIKTLFYSLFCSYLCVNLVNYANC